jgi:hypothetical protein
MIQPVIPHPGVPQTAAYFSLGAGLGPGTLLISEGMSRHWFMQIRARICWHGHALDGRNMIIECQQVRVGEGWQNQVEQFYLCGDLEQFYLAGHKPSKMHARFVAYSFEEFVRHYFGHQN